MEGRPAPLDRRLAFAALGAVILQGLLGGLTVLLLLPAPVSVGHAGLAQLFFCATVGLALFTSSSWRASQPPPDDPWLRRMSLSMTVFDVHPQILLGATMRHTGAGLAMDFRWRSAASLPPVWNAGIAVHFAHRVGALIVLIAVYRDRDPRVAPARRSDGARLPSLLLVLLVGGQATLGAYVVLSGLHPLINTAHVVNGALVLATSLVLTLRTFANGFTLERAPGVEQQDLAPIEVRS